MAVPLPVECMSLGQPARDLCGPYGETNENIISTMETFTSECNIHSDGCWGFFVVRTAYNDNSGDDRIAAAMLRLEDAVHNIIACWRRDSEWDNCQEIDDFARSRYHSVLVQDPSLAGATIPGARSYFQDWARPWCPVDEDFPNKFNRSARFGAFILLDEQVLANIETLPARGDLDAFEELFLHTTTQWVKLIDTDNEDPEMGQIAVSAYDLAKTFRKLADEVHGLETFPRDTGVSDEFTGTELGWERFDV